MHYLIKGLTLLLLITACENQQRAEKQPTFDLKVEVVDSGTQALLQAFARDEQGALYLSGHDNMAGAFNEAKDRMQWWGLPTGLDTLQFRDLDVRAGVKLVMSAGTGSNSRIYRQAGDSEPWQEVFRAEGVAFLNSIAFVSDSYAIAFGDAVDEVPYILESRDVGQTWQRIDAERLPAALADEGGFAASGSSILVLDEQRVLIATGNAAVSRMLISEDGGGSWRAMTTDLPGGPSRGACGVVRGVGEVVWLFGGDLSVPQDSSARLQAYDVKADSLHPVQLPAFKGAIYGYSVLQGAEMGQELHAAANPNGLFVRRGAEGAWVRQDSLSYWALVSSEKHIFAAGPQGRIRILSISEPAGP